MTTGKRWILTGCVLTFLAVAFGAFGAHGIEQAIVQWYGAEDLPTPLDDQNEAASQIDTNAAEPPEWFQLNDLHRKKLKTWITGVRYHVIHALAILALGIVILHSGSKPSSLYDWAGYFFILGIIGFSGSIYALVITKIRILGMTAALGGIFQLTGWTLFTLAVLKTKFQPASAALLSDSSETHKGK